MSLLFTPIRLQNYTSPNRLVVSPMCQYSAVNGYANDWHLVHLGQFAIGKVGIIIQEATAVTPEGRISYGDLGIWEDEHIPSYKRIVDFVHQQGSLIGIQLAHAGRKASNDKPWLGRGQIAPGHENGWQTVAPTAIPYSDNDSTPKALSINDMENLVKSFKDAALRAIEAGYDIIEIHAAHGYLIHQFLSPLTNLRTDNYGGTYENRTRFLKEIIHAVKSVLTEQSLWLRISATDWADGGWNLEESTKLANEVKELGIEVIDVSSGGNVPHQQIEIKPNYQVPFAATIKASSNLITGAVGLIKKAEQAEKILQDGEADLILIGRGFLQNPHLAIQFADTLNEDINWLPQYARGKETK